MAFAHRGIEMPTKEHVDRVAERAACRVPGWLPQRMPDPIGYICAHRSHGNMTEFSYDQGYTRGPKQCGVHIRRSCRA
jgi:hypothetical protein